MTSVHNIGAVAKALILKAHQTGKAISNDDLAQLVVSIFKSKGVEVKTGASSIAWYKNDMRKKGMLPKGAMVGGAKKIEFNVDEFDFNTKPSEQSTKPSEQSTESKEQSTEHEEEEQQS